MRDRSINRRTVLRGLGGIAVGMPFLEEMMTPAMAKAASPAVPMRAFNVFFGLGIPAPLQGEGFEGVLEPLKQLSDKLLILRGVDHVRCDQSGINAHFDGSAAAFTAAPPDGEARSGGPSIDQVVRHAHYRDGLPAGMVPTLMGGTYFRRSRISRYVHSYNHDGTVAGTIQEKPRDLFERVFGVIPGAADGGTAGEAEARVRRSVLDSVVDQYQHYTGANSPLGAASKSRISDHLDRVREYEQRAYQMAADESAPGLPPRSEVPHGGLADPGGQGIDITLEELTREWHLMADLYALSIQMDRARFGSITFLAAGERIRLTGDYLFEGEHRFTFDDSTHLRASGDKGCSHEYWHKFNEGRENRELRMHAHMKLREIAYFLNLLDGEDAVDENGRTILENAMITVSTESGDGRHNDVKRELSGVFHAVSSAGGRFKTGEILDVNAEGIDVYNTMLKVMGTGHQLGPEGREAHEVAGMVS